MVFNAMASGKPTYEELKQRCQAAERRLAELGDTERSYRHLVENAPLGIVVSNSNHHYTHINAAGAHMLGFGSTEKALEHINALGPQFHHPAERRVELLDRVRKAGRIKDFETQVRGRDQRMIWLNVTARLSRGHSDGSFDLECFVTDITKRRQAEEDLHKALERQQLAVAAGRVGLWDWDLLTNLVEYSKEWKRQVGHEAHEIADDFIEWEKRVHPEDLEATKRLVMNAIEGGHGHYHVEFRFRHRDGHYLNILAHGAVLRDAEGRPLRAMGSHVDITPLRRAESLAREHEQRLNLALEGAGLGTWDWNVVTGEVAFDQRWAEMLGYRLDEIEPHVRSWEKLVHPEDMPFVSETLQAHLDGRTPSYEAEFRMRHKSGRWIWILDRGRALQRNAKGEPLRACGTHLDITARREAEAALHENEERLRLVAGATTDLIYEWEVATDRLIWYGPLEATLGYEPGEIDETIEAWVALIHPEDAHRLRDSVQRHREATEAIRETYRVRRKDGSWVWWSDIGLPVLDETGKPRRWIGGCRDITHERHLEEQYRHAQKMEAIGQLTGGVAHDFNNLLQVINGGTELALEDIELAHPAHEPLEEVAQAGRRAARLVEQLLLFSRRQIMRPEPLDINHTVDDMLKMLRRFIGEHIRVDWLPAPALGLVQADRGMLEQALMNLCLNARDAMDKGGALTIATQRRELDEAFCMENEWAQPGRYAVLSVSDTGHGIPPEMLERIFEPFFTTKDPGKGTGLGLATVYGIVRQHEGLVEVESEPDRGTRITLYWPLSSEANEQATPRTDSEPLNPGRGECILLAEDDESVRRLATRILERAGYRVLAASNGREALRLYDESPEKIDLALLDVVMPVLGGRETADALLERQHDMRILYASGYNENAIHKDFVLDRGTRLLSKPFHRAELLRQVRETLETSPGR